jgi:alkyldihydroxyacetonephosphate synthase
MLKDLKRNLWGYVDIYFKIVSNYVILHGSHYEICNKIIPNLLNFICGIFNHSSLFDQVIKENDLGKYYIDLDNNSDRESSELKNFIQFLESDNPIKYSTKGIDRVEHSHGQLSVDEIYRLRYGDHTKISLVDIVVYPTDEDQIQHIYTEAKEKSYKIIPYGGGTNVTGCLMIQKSDDKKLYISMDMRYFNKILKVNTSNNYAIIQSGACGREIEDELNKIGYTMGHEPDSYEFSTLGGWISTYASGMRRYKYGNIEDIVIDFGYINDYSKKIDISFSVRHSHGSKINNILFGHEGNLCIITDVLVKIKKIPEDKLFDSVLLYNITDGIKFLKEVHESNIQLSSIRLVDNEQFKFGQALKPQKTFFKSLIDKITKFYLFNILKFDPHQMVACTLMFEGSSEQNKFNLNLIKKIASKYNGILGGSENGKAGYNLTHSIAYIRDFTHEYNIIGETFDTSIEWSKIEDMAESVKLICKEEANKYLENYKPFISYRISQLYDTGVCVYFTFSFYNNMKSADNNMESAEEGIKIYHLLENKMREVMIEKGGSISHHHGIGQIKNEELKNHLKNEELKNHLKITDSCFMIELNKSIKKLFDEKNVLSNNGILMTD